MIKYYRGNPMTCTIMISFQFKKFSNNLVDELNLKVNFAYGRIKYLKKFSISDNYFQCEGDSNLLDEYPLLSFNCLIALNNKKDLEFILSSYKPPIFWKDKELVKHQLQIWSLEQIKSLIKKINNLELLIKKKFTNIKSINE